MVTANNAAANNAASQVVPVGQPHSFEPVYTAADKENALKQCAAIINVPACRDLKALDPIHEKNAIETCSKDYLRTGGHVFTNSHLQGYMAQCQQMALATVNSPVVIANNATAPAAAIIVTVGYGKHECPNSCSGKGVCGETGCQCVAPFSGIDCSINTSTYAAPAQAPIIQYNNGTQVQGVFCNPVEIAQNQIVQAAINIPVAHVDYTPQPAAVVPGSAPAGVIPVANPVQVVYGAKSTNAPAAAVPTKAAVMTGNVLASGAIAVVTSSLFFLAAASFF
ncbi:hypothetical protein HDU81_002096 [Chytriomyces hyalinus]|nr:hypothetical protein HDU81_002096 [Chytriomyces hyalinus]